MAWRDIVRSPNNPLQGFSGGRGFFFQDFPNTYYSFWFFQW